MYGSPASNITISKTYIIGILNGVHFQKDGKEMSSSLRMMKKNTSTEKEKESKPTIKKSNLSKIFHFLLILLSKCTSIMKGDDSV